MLIGIIAFGILSGILGSVMALAAFGSVLVAVVAYMMFGSLGAMLFAMAAAQRSAMNTEPEDEADAAPRG